MSKGERVALVGFGSFSVSKRAARKGRNPQNGKEIKIPAKKVVKFKAGADLARKLSKLTLSILRFITKIPPKSGILCSSCPNGLTKKSMEVTFSFLCPLSLLCVHCGYF